jgi:hypothetical protein
VRQIDGENVLILILISLQKTNIDLIISCDAFLLEECIERVHIPGFRRCISLKHLLELGTQVSVVRSIYVVLDICNLCFFYQGKGP